MMVKSVAIHNYNGCQNSLLDSSGLEPLWIQIVCRGWGDATMKQVLSALKNVVQPRPGRKILGLPFMRRRVAMPVCSYTAESYRPGDQAPPLSRFGAAAMKIW